MDRNKIKQSIEACNDFCCGECPHEHLDSKDYPFRCIHTLISDIYKIMKEENDMMIGGVPKEKWIKAFADAVNIAIDKDYFSDILYFDLYPDADDEKAEDLWNNVDAAFKEIFGIDRNS